MIGKVIGFYVNAGTGAVRLAANVTNEALKLVGSVAERAMGVSRTPSAEPGYREAAAASRAATDGPTEAAEPAPRETAPAPAPPASPPAPPAPPEPSAETATPAPEPPAPPERPPAVDYDAAPPTPIDHDQEVAKTLDEEPELVAEFAERGAENGAGAKATVDEPWEGYAQMNADAVIARIGEADVAELAVVELYERAHGQRRTVLRAAERRHRSLTGPGASQ